LPPSHKLSPTELVETIVDGEAEVNENISIKVDCAGAAPAGVAEASCQEFVVEKECESGKWNDYK
jgi:hypothetical protein